MSFKNSLIPISAHVQTGFRWNGSQTNEKNCCIYARKRPITNLNLGSYRKYLFRSIQGFRWTGSQKGRKWSKTCRITLLSLEPVTFRTFGPVTLQTSELFKKIQCNLMTLPTINNGPICISFRHQVKSSLLITLRPK